MRQSHLPNAQSQCVSTYLGDARTSIERKMIACESVVDVWRTISRRRWRTRRVEDPVENHSGIKSNETPVRDSAGTCAVTYLSNRISLTSWPSRLRNGVPLTWEWINWRNRCSRRYHFGLSIFIPLSPPPPPPGMYIVALLRVSKVLSATR